MLTNGNRVVTVKVNAGLVPRGFEELFDFSVIAPAVTPPATASATATITTTTPVCADNTRATLVRGQYGGREWWEDDDARARGAE